MDGSRFHKRTTQQFWNRAMYKNQFYILIYDLLYFNGRNGIILLVAQRKEVPKFLYEFYNEICVGNFARQITV